MKIPEETLRRLKRATSDSLQKAQASGDPYAIAEAKRDDEFADDLLRKNKAGAITATDVLHVVSLIDRVERLIEFLKNFPWDDLL